MSAAGRGEASETPRVSVIVQTYDHRDFIAQAIEGVLMQRASFPVEVIVADDASTDGTRELVRTYAGSHPDRLRAVLPERNLGPSATFERALGEARGEYVAYLDGDDFWTSPHKLSRQVQALDAHPGWAGCFHRASLAYGPTGHPHRTGHAIPDFDRTEARLEDLVAGVCFLPGPSWMHRRSSLRRLPSLDGVEWSDWLIHIMVARDGALGFLDEVMAAYRVHAGGAFSGLDRSAQLEEDLRFFGRLGAELPACEELIERCVANRRCQLAVESARLPYESPLLVVGPDDGVPLYFNGRGSARFPDGAGEASAAELDRACASLAMMAPAVPDARPRQGPLEPASPAEAFVVVPRRARPWMDSNREISERIEERATTVLKDDWCEIHRLELDEAPTGSRAVAGGPGGDHEVVAVTVAEPLPVGVDGRLEAPTPDDPVAAHAVYVLGWALGEAEPIDFVDFELGGELICRAPVQVARPDLAEAFPDRPGAGAAGFRTIVNVLGTEEIGGGAGTGQEIEVELTTVGRSGARLPFGRLSLRRRG
jgi:hypothetical protein